MEKTYVMFKPDTVKRKLSGRILQMFEDKGLDIVAMKMMTLTPEILKEHYSHILHLDVYPSIEEFMTSGPVIAMILQGNEAVNTVLKMRGPTQYSNLVPGTIRAMFATSTSNNIYHCSDSLENAAIEIERFFGKEYLN